MNSQKLQENTQRLHKAQATCAAEPTVISEKSNTNSLFVADFNQALTTAITMDELKQHLYKVIDAWPWNEK